MHPIDIDPISLNESIDQLNYQLSKLHDNTQMHFIKRKKILLQLERTHNQYHRLNYQTGLNIQQKLDTNAIIIRSIKKQIIAEDRQQKKIYQGEQAKHMNQGRTQIIALAGTVLAGLVSAATLFVIT